MRTGSALAERTAKGLRLAGAVELLAALLRWSC